MQNTGNESDARTSNIPEEPKSNTEHPMMCIFNRGHTNISLRKFRQHLRICKERVKVTQLMLAPEEREKNTKGTTRAKVKGKSYHHGEVYKSSKHEELGHMEVWLDRP
jgi:hypothetical protein